MTRRIEDALGPWQHLDGRARFSERPDGMEYLEQGMLRLGDGPILQATRQYIWRQDKDGIAVCFPDGRAFHRFDPGLPVPEARHDCPPDLYLVRYDFRAWPVWTAEWQVSGPRKDYRMLSLYSRPSGASG